MKAFGSISISEIRSSTKGRKKEKGIKRSRKDFSVEVKSFSGAGMGSEKSFGRSFPHFGMMVQLSLRRKCTRNAPPICMARCIMKELSRIIMVTKRK